MFRSKAESWIGRAFLAILVALVTTVVMSGGELPRMPGPRVLPKAAESPGAVTFNHVSHVDAGRPDCTACHPRLFSILKKTSADQKIVHAKMEKGGSCGACHGKTAFNFDDCTACHR